MTLHTPWAHPECTGGEWWTSQSKGWLLVVLKANWTRCAQIHVYRRKLRVVMDPDAFMRSVMNANDRHDIVVQGETVVLRISCDGILSGRRAGSCCGR